MPHNALIELIPTLRNRRQLCLIGAAVVDIVTETPCLPQRGGDLEMQEKGIHVGGCALNIAISINRLGLESVNALPLGNGKWAELIRHAMNEKVCKAVYRIQVVTMVGAWRWLNRTVKERSCRLVVSRTIGRKRH